MADIAVTPRTQVRRLPQRAVYDRAAVDAILDEGFLCHVGFVADGQPYVIPTGYGRAGDDLYLHGSAASRLVRTLADGVPVGVTVTLLDGLVLARSAYHHSMNYRSVVVLGRAVEVTEERERLSALETISEHIIRGRWADIRSPSPLELKATRVLRLPIEEASAKVRTGPPVDDEEDYGLPCWAGVLPFRVEVGPPLADPRLTPGIQPPASVRQYHRPGATTAATD
jgi:nitroimidazol reductase NimA-like FMN-containing flavoprotein (pyridoxamine 5'-phosphate oxidase superfamily)